MWPEFSRGRLQKWIKAGAITANDRPVQNKTTVRGGERVRLLAELTPEQNWSPQAAELDVRFEDDDFLIVNKSAGVVVHPAPGHAENTLVNALLYHAPQLAHLPRAGIIHRLDKETTGLLVVAKSLMAHAALVEALQARRIKRAYLALVWGLVTGSNTVNKPIGRHPRVRTKMAVVDSGKPAVTHFQIKQRFAQHTLLDVQLETGRTHQIRVHLASMGLPIVGDPVYGGRQRVVAGASFLVRERVAAFRRQ
ncbi:MAG: RluA family pseudouridine synthase, partial [Gammaproteobacteria bacterium]